VDGILIQAGDGERVAREHRYHTILAELPELEVIELRFGPDFEGVDPHSHADHVDSFYVLDGEVRYEFAEQSMLAGPGTFVSAPLHVTHGFRPVGPARVFNMHAPDAGFAGRVRRR
jgi:quercetin dioxygenase-like cupin family protein